MVQPNLFLHLLTVQNHNWVPRYSNWSIHCKVWSLVFKRECRRRCRRRSVERV